MKKNSDKEAFTFDKGIERLEQIINDLDQNNVQLEQSLDLFGEGVKLIKQCNGLLDSAEAKVKVLLENSKGELVVTDQD
ncbi:MULTISPECIES: exodeoxyribonuclease VII small subunit [Dehalobacter]|jgi:exodeoxyribonuclease VII small subunit|uniref:Exodeoxyribonuclease 7 small subunit n=2 Tax=Dehalobacter restrictus TaxID=55583 RepID=A0A857DJP5_9FIRM|nr:MULTISPECIES: exodeoxyribonuclease VII small subunit [Dehalobacter]AHF09799.1 exodeoxyribonuclease VII [Dehalobacter restrictus DSM 9455]MCG1026087.1 exodeoxyribonuclease VII small subunit [Dehalobacter sp.]MDJ0305014.1 exodeoxyribonuclease VII small subunit [Dehalobacter sp.]OCZ53424.1 exodeoxyribonuclease VII small subunit [Dehalobacter sp. TeCB1]QHA00386.1 exodeoxyribonuclease VII small subunit [Dehalobacter restrictus]